MENSTTIDSLRVQIFRAINETQNLNLLNKMMNLIEKEGSSEASAIGFNTDGSPISRSQLSLDIQESRDQFDKGDFISIEELEEESQSWV